MDFRDKTKLKIAISKLKNNEKVMKKNNLYKVATVACCTFAFTGVAFATQSIIEKIWKEPETYNYSYEITEQDKQNAISENDAKNKAIEYLRKIGLEEDMPIEHKMLTKSIENAQKKVEKAYLHNTQYWLAYCISAVMLWANDEPAAAQRAMCKSLSVNPRNSALFYLLINLRFNRIDAAKKWYVHYLDQTDMNDLGDEWQYLLLYRIFLKYFVSNQTFHTFAL